MNVKITTSPALSAILHTGRIFPWTPVPIEKRAVATLDRSLRKLRESDLERYRNNSILRRYASQVAWKTGFAASQCGSPLNSIALLAKVYKTLAHPKESHSLQDDFSITALESLPIAGGTSPLLQLVITNYYVGWSQHSKNVIVPPTIDANPNKEKIEPLLVESREHLKFSRYDEAYLSLAEAEDLNWEDPKIQYLLGVVFYTQGHHKSAIERFTAVLSTEPDYPIARMRRADAYLALNLPDKANEDLVYLGYVSLLK